MPPPSQVAPRAIRIALWALGALTAVYGALLALDPGAQQNVVVDETVYNALLAAGAAICLLRVPGARRGPARLVWLAFGLGLALQAAGNVGWSIAYATVEDPPYPSFADVLWWASYVPLYAGVVLLVRRSRDDSGGAIWLDGLIAALAVAALSATVVVGSVHAALDIEDFQTVATNLSYPLLDLLLLAFLAAGFALRGWRADRRLAFLAAGLVTFAVTDSFYLAMTARGDYFAGSIIDVGWPLAGFLVAVAAWQPAPAVDRVSSRGRWPVFVLPAAFASVPLALLVADHFARLNTYAVALAGACLVAVIARMALTFRLNLRIIASARTEARTDSLTGLGNRRALFEDLARIHAQAEPRALVMYDLNGFKAYNDAFGHPAGDALLARLGGRLAERVGSGGGAYRMGGDEFCALVPAEPGAVEAAARWLARALEERGDGFAVEAAWGAVAIPSETDDPVTALKIADGRLYATKHGARPTPERQSADVLLSALAERDPWLGTHLKGVGRLAAATARRLGLDAVEVEHVRHAAELHDVGKVAIPETILSKPGPLDAGEWEFMRRHTLIGERILSAAPALTPVARLVRSSHERWDGRGYPDGLRGDAIPLGARIVAVCDAFDAMTSDRAYRRGVSDADALEELRRCAGRQFDPRVVEAFAAALDEERSRPVVAKAA